jgi:hypothetical protein
MQQALSRMVDEFTHPPGASRELELREIFVQLTRLNGKYDAASLARSDQSVDIEKLTKRVDDMEAARISEMLRNAGDDVRAQIIRWALDGAIVIVAAVVGAGYFFK